MKRFYLPLAMLLFTASVYGQETVNNEEPQRPERVYYLQATGGANYSMSENTRFHKFFENTRPVGNASLGMEFNPYWGMDVQFGYNRNARITDEWEQGEAIYTKIYFNSVELFLNGSYNLSNGIRGFNPERKLNVYFYAGVGLAYTFGDHANGIEAANNFVPGVRGGFTGAYVFNKRVAAIMDLGMYAFTDNFNAFKRQIPADGRLNAQLGVRFYLGDEGGEKWVREPKIEYVEIEKTIVQTDTIRIIDTIVERIINESEISSKVEVVFFEVNSFDIQEDELSKVEAIADYLNAHPEKVVFVIGSADRNTGNEEINSKLRAGRARAVSEMLVNKYGIEKSRVKAFMGKGTGDDLYKKQYIKNRAAICIITDFEQE